LFHRPELFDDIKVLVEAEDGTREEWKRLDDMLSASKDDKVYVVDPVDGTLTFGNGIRGRMLPVGSNNIIVDTYRVVPGAKGNVGPHEIVVGEGAAAKVNVTNLLPAVGGRDAESIEEIVRRAPSILTSRDRAVTRADFEIIAREASGEVSRAACNGRMDADGKVEIVILPGRREGEVIPDPFLAAGLRDHVGAYLKRRCLVNVDPVVRLARFLPVDVSIELRMRPYANVLAVRESAEKWVRNFLDAYTGGLDREGWPFGGTLYAQDFARMVGEIPEVRHVVEVRLFPMAQAGPQDPPGWESTDGVEELFLTTHDLFVVRRVRVRTEEVGA
jgi:predicted phage baseplate assembly protein